MRTKTLEIYREQKQVDQQHRNLSNVHNACSAVLSRNSTTSSEQSKI